MKSLQTFPNTLSRLFLGRVPEDRQSKYSLSYQQEPETQAVKGLPMPVSFTMSTVILMQQPVAIPSAAHCSPLRDVFLLLLGTAHPDALCSGSQRVQKRTHPPLSFPASTAPPLSIDWTTHHQPLWTELSRTALSNTKATSHVQLFTYKLTAV